MIVTLTANPSVDRTMAIDGPIRPGEVFKALSVGDEAGGKGVNVARAVAHAGVPAVAVLPADHDDLLIKGLVEAGVHPINVPVGRPSRVNITVTESDGTTTKFNDPGHAFSASVYADLERHLLTRSHGNGWVVLCGSLPPSAPIDWYAVLTSRLREAGRRVAVDTSGDALLATVAGAQRPDLLKPNAEELASLTGCDPAQLEADSAAAEEAARTLVAGGVGAVLLTLGAQGALLITAAEGSWRATPPPISLRSTVGAGDASLAGYLLADQRGLGPADRLREAVAFGAAAASLPGSTMPRESDLDRDGVTVTLPSIAL